MPVRLDPFRLITNVHWADTTEGPTEPPSGGGSIGTEDYHTIVRTVYRPPNVGVSTEANRYLNESITGGPAGELISGTYVYPGAGIAGISVERQTLDHPTIGTSPSSSWVAIFFGGSRDSNVALLAGKTLYVDGDAVLVFSDNTTSFMNNYWESYNSDAQCYYWHGDGVPWTYPDPVPEYVCDLAAGEHEIWIE